MDNPASKQSKSNHNKHESIEIILKKEIDVIKQGIKKIQSEYNHNKHESIEIILKDDRDAKNQGINIHSVPCPYGHPSVKIIIRDNLKPEANGDVIQNRLKRGPFLSAMCPLANQVIHLTAYDRDEFEKEFEKLMVKYGCPNPQHKPKPYSMDMSCSYNSGNWEKLQHFVR